MPKTKKTGRAPNYMTVGMLQGELRKIGKGLNALSRQMQNMKKDRPITKPGAAWIIPGPWVVGEICKKLLWKDDLDVRELGPAVKKLSAHLGRVARYIEPRRPRQERKR
jgi:hypothetical protein